MYLSSKKCLLQEFITHENILFEFQANYCGQNFVLYEIQWLLFKDLQRYAHKKDHLTSAELQWMILSNCSTLNHKSLFSKL